MGSEDRQALGQYLCINLVIFRRFQFDKEWHGLLGGQRPN
ncbi:hypothetical protein PsalN5692_02178 [Piscirickettsia salmonis]|nr:hypothetical protein PsalN5692_02178 [Piscirickettsia salmonis]